MSFGFGRGFHLHPRQCVSCEDESPTCNCAADENCVLTSRTCSQCPTITCNKKPGAASSGVNPGVIAGPVVAVLVIASLVLFWYLRRKKRRDLARLEELAARARKAEIAGFHLSQPGSPSPGSARSLPSARSNPRSSRQSHSILAAGGAGGGGGKRRSQRSPLPPAPQTAQYYDESGALVRVYGGNGQINLDPNHPDNGGSGDPFSDNGDAGSFSTRGTETTASTRIIPIQMVSPEEFARDDDGSDDSGSGEQRRPRSQAARTLNEAREVLLRNGPPTRPARAPGLDLRLNAGQSAEDVHGAESEDMSGGAGRVRESYLSGTSGAPSFSSGYTSDLHTDAPKIFTSKHVQLGRFHQAEVVSFGQQQLRHPPNPNNVTPPTAQIERSVSPTLSAVRTPFNDPSTVPARTLTPTGGGNARRYDPSEAEELPSPDPNHHPAPNGVSPTDLRFSMGSLAYRSSVSSMGTERYLARPDSSFGPVPPRAPWASGSGQGRESIMSGRSDGDSVWGNYPMIPPSGAGSSTASPGFPTSSSVATLGEPTVVARPDVPSASSPAGGSNSQRTPPPPPPAYRAPSSRPQTSASIADSILGAFPFVPPTQVDMAELPSARIPETAWRTGSSGGPAPGTRNATARNTAMSGVSEGLGGFEFRFAGADEERGPVPPMPSGVMESGGTRPSTAGTGIARRE